jgi:hypothetical protein
MEDMMERAWDNGGAQGVEDALSGAKCDLFNESFLPD